jgi:predicted heme/steroid binding protein
MNMSALPILFAIVFILFLPHANARHEYASDTGQSCSTCHIDQITGELNDVGKTFSINHQWPPVEVSSKKRIIVSLVGFIHMLAGMILVGSMVFVHIIHTPSALAVSGVPKNELKLGWTSLTFIAVSGIYLTINRFHDLEGLLNADSGRLVLGKIFLFSIMVTFASLLTFVINKKLKSSMHQHPLVEDIDSEMTLEELEKFDGSSDETFIAYAGVVFDVSNSRLWKGGLHMRKHNAGTDLTQVLREAPHGPQVLDAFQAVSRIKQEKEKISGNWVVRIFKAAAVINFICALVTVLLSALIAWPL